MILPFQHLVINLVPAIHIENICSSIIKAQRLSHLDLNQTSILHPESFFVSTKHIVSAVHIGFERNSSCNSHRSCEHRCCCYCHLHPVHTEHSYNHDFPFWLQYASGIIISKNAHDMRDNGTRTRFLILCCFIVVWLFWKVYSEPVFVVSLLLVQLQWEYDNMWDSRTMQSYKDVVLPLSSWC